MKPFPRHDVIKKLLAESLNAISNKPVASAQDVGRPAALFQIETIAGEGLAEACLDQIRKRGPRFQVPKGSRKIICAAWSRCAARNN